MTENIKCPECDSDMVIGVSHRGPNAGKLFYVCPHYPECSGKILISVEKDSVGFLVKQEEKTEPSTPYADQKEDKVEHKRPVDSKKRGKRKFSRLGCAGVIVIGILIVLIVSIFILGDEDTNDQDDTHNQESTYYQQGYSAGHTEGRVNAICDCQYEKGLLSLDEYTDCIPDNTSGMNKSASYNEGHSEGYIDGFASYSCN
jgi:ssDNA-binding Zn-finger/Zn-ribbon topoisomerase 1